MMTSCMTFSLVIIITLCYMSGIRNTLQNWHLQNIFAIFHSIIALNSSLQWTWSWTNRWSLCAHVHSIHPLYNLGGFHTIIITTKRKNSKMLCFFTTMSKGIERRRELMRLKNLWHEHLLAFQCSRELYYSTATFALSFYSSA